MQVTSKSNLLSKPNFNNSYFRSPKFMAQNSEEKIQGSNSLAIIIFVIIVSAAFFGAVITLLYPDFISMLSGGTYVSGGAIYDAIYVILTLAADALYLFGGGVITFGAILVIIRFVQSKLKNPYQPSSSTRYLSGYLTLSLNFFIGAEIIRTVACLLY